MAETVKEAPAASATSQPRPGDTIAPAGSQAQPIEQNPAAPVMPPSSVAAPESLLPAQQTSAQPQPAAPEAAAASFDKTVPPTAATDRDGAISWTASEFVAHEKSAGWYGALTGSAIIIAALIYLVTKDSITAIVVIVGALFLGIYAGRKPRQLMYQLDDSGITVGAKHYQYEEFRSFGVVPEGAFSSIVFMPLKRFAPTTSIYYAPEDEDKIADLLAERLPFQEYGHDVVDRLMRRIRF